MSYMIAIHPGQVLQDELDERSISQTALAKHIRVLPKTVNEICRGKRGITADMALRLSAALGASPQFWMNLQSNWEISQLKQPSIRPLKKVAA